MKKRGNWELDQWMLEVWLKLGVWLLTITDNNRDIHKIQFNTLKIIQQLLKYFCFFPVLLC